MNIGYLHSDKSAKLHSGVRGRCWEVAVSCFGAYKSYDISFDAPTSELACTCSSISESETFLILVLVAEQP